MRRDSPIYVLIIALGQVEHLSPLLFLPLCKTNSTFTPININPVPIQNQKGKNKLSDLALNCLEPVLVDSTQDRRTCVEDAPEDKDENLESLL
ncbi:hypothetical protein C2G38_2155653 [Gigaspora rosea]|uniref:Uncharacterized protein n=1 Tax=Gigaspora rosea TaxID=44941 RepID=A0A397W9X3_9GLOM|nr:hypothetical protein C2G38_2155653 [Gigaspora rosea]